MYIYLSIYYIYIKYNIYNIYILYIYILLSIDSPMEIRKVRNIAV